MIDTFVGKILFVGVFRCDENIIGLSTVSSVFFLVVQNCLIFAMRFRIPTKDMTATVISRRDKKDAGIR